MSEQKITHQSTVRQLSVQEILGPGGLISHILPGYESRPGQVMLAEYGYQAIRNSDSIIAEAGTGSGKTFAYLIPALVAGEKVIVSTSTVVLQAQLQDKDLPFLQAIFPRMTWCTIKGRQRYVCKREIQKIDRELQDDLFRLESQASVESWNAVQEWVMNESKNGGLADLDTFPEHLTDDVREAITVDSERCSGKACKFYESCFAEQAKRRAKQADVIVVNHYILLLDLLLRQHGTSLLPNRNTIILDEAHTLEAVASDVSATHVGYSRWRWLQARLTTLTESAKQRIAAMPVPSIDTVEGLIRQIDGADPQELTTLMDAAVDAGALALSEAKLKFDTWVNQFGEESQSSVPDDAAALVSATQTWEAALTAVVKHLERLKLDEEISDHDETDGEQTEEEAEEDSGVSVNDWSKLTDMVQRLRTDLQLCLCDAPNYVRYIEQHDRRGQAWATLARSMIHVGAWLQECLWKQFNTISTSATLTTYEAGRGPRFEYWSDRVGHPDAGTLIVESPFDFQHNCLIYTPSVASTFEPPAKREGGESAQRYQQRKDAYHEHIALEILQLITASQGRALVLFTSSAAMRKTADLVRPTLPWRLLVQGDLQRLPLLEAFKTDCSSVLFATRSFWQGIDVSGESLSLLVIDKFPFEVPNTPLARARVEDVKRRFGSSADWNKLTLPAMLTLLRQGAGRLIRRMDDRGVIAVLDGRVKSKSYGTTALKSLPPGRHISNLSEVQRFFLEGSHE